MGRWETTNHLDTTVAPEAVWGKAYADADAWPAWNEEIAGGPVATGHGAARGPRRARGATRDRRPGGKLKPMHLESRSPYSSSSRGSSTWRRETFGAAAAPEGDGSDIDHTRVG
jgi:hypothetical protein